MSAPIKRYSTAYQWQDGAAIKSGHICQAIDGEYVLHSDHLSSHAYDESVERAAFKEWLSEAIWGNEDWKAGLERAWLASAKSRAKRAGWVE